MADNDWLSRNNLADINPGRRDTFSSAGKPGASGILNSVITPPGTRPLVYQRARNFNLTADVTPVALVAGNFQCDTIILNVLSTAPNSVFFGFSSSINATTGMELQPGIPIGFSASNTREMWELQRLLEAIAAMLAADRGISPLGFFRAPEVVFDASDYFLMAAAPTTVRVMLFLTPELQ